MMAELGANKNAARDQKRTARLLKAKFRTGQKFIYNDRFLPSPGLQVSGTILRGPKSGKFREGLYKNEM